MVFVPLSRDGAEQLRAGADVGHCRGCAATPTLLTALGGDTSTEEAEYAALNHAGVLALFATTDPERLVLAAEVTASQVDDRQTQHGEVQVCELRWNQVTALFADVADVAETVAAARSAAGSGGLGEALATPAIQLLLDTDDLGWFAVDELDQLT